MKTQTFQFTKNTISLGCTRYGRTPDELLLCTKSIYYFLGETPHKITIKVSTERIHSKGCRKIERKPYCDYPHVDGVVMPPGTVWYSDLNRAVVLLGLGDVFYIIVSRA